MGVLVGVERRLRDWRYLSTLSCGVSSFHNTKAAESARAVRRVSCLPGQHKEPRLVPRSIGSPEHQRGSANYPSRHVPTSRHESGLTLKGGVMAFTLGEPTTESVRILTKEWRRIFDEDHQSSERLLVAMGLQERPSTDLRKVL